MPKWGPFWHIRNLEQNDFESFLEKLDFPATISQYEGVWRFQSVRKQLEGVLGILLHTHIIAFGRVLVKEKNIFEAWQNGARFGNLNLVSFLILHFVQARSLNIFLWVGLQWHTCDDEKCFLLCLSSFIPLLNLTRPRKSCEIQGGTKLDNHGKFKLPKSVRFWHSSKMFFSFTNTRPKAMIWVCRSILRTSSNCFRTF